MWMSRREYKLLQESVEYWRKQYERERERADKLTNNLLQTNGLPPASAIETTTTNSRDHLGPMTKKLAEQMAELFNSEIEDSLEVDTSEAAEAN